MKRDQKKAIQKQKRQAAEARRVQKHKALDERDLLDELEEDMEEDQLSADSDQPLEETDGDAGEPIQKEYTADGMWMGPTSFEELDAMDHAREQANQINHVSWSVQDLVYNIIRHPLLDPKEKNKAIKKVGDGFEKRVDSILGGDMIHKDLDLLSIEAILAHDSRHTSLMEKAADFIIKRKLTGAAREKLSDESFALPSKRKYPIHDKAHVRNALSRAAQQIKAGGEGAADARAALPKIRAAAKKFGIEMDTEKEKSGLLIEKDSSGTWRWVGWSTNKYMDWDGEILKDAAHKEYTEWLDQNPDMAPVFMSWHEDDTVRKHAVDFWMYENGFMVMSGVLEEDEAEGLLNVQKEIDLGMSHRSIVLKRDPQDRNYIEKYRMYEVSDLPRDNAANPFTGLETVAKEAGMKKEEYFEKLFGKDKAEKYLALTKEAGESLDAAGVQSKEKKEESATEPTAPLTAPTAPVAPITLDAKAVDEIAKVLGEKFGMSELNAYLSQLSAQAEKVPVLEELVKALAENQDQRLAEAINPPASTFVWMQKNRASQSKDTELDPDNEEDDKLKKSGPALTAEDWLAQAVGVQPIRMQQ